MHVPVGQKDQKLGDNVHSLPSSRFKIDFQDILIPPNLAGRLLHFLPNWRQITSDPDILMTVAGYKLPFTLPPHQTSAKAPLTFSQHESEKVDSEVALLREKGVLHVACPVPDQFVSSLFLVPKRDGNSRAVINLKDLNVFLQYDHFKMEGIHLLRDLLQPNDWLGKIDLKDAYFVIPIWRDHRKYLRFVWKQTLLEFACLPFGLAVAPRVFTKIMKPVVSLLRRTGIRLIIYLDDILLMNASENGLRQDMHTAQYLLENLGFVINLEKSCFQPTQQLEFLGFLVSTRDMTLLLPDCKVSSIKTLCSTLLSQRDVSVRELSQLIGKLTASIQAVFPAPLHYRNLQQLKHQALSRDRNFDSRIPLSVEAIDELRWWLAHLDAWRPTRLEWVGGCLSRHPNRGPVVSDGAEAPYQLSGAPGGIVCDPKLYEKSVVCSCAPTHGQYFCGGLSQPFRWDSFVGSLQSGSCSMGVGLDTQYLPQCRAHSGQSERFSRLGVAQFSGFKQLETLSGNFPFPNADPRPLHARPLCGSLELSTFPILQLETGPNGVSHGCVSTELVNRKELCVSHFLSNHALPCEAESGRGRVDSCHSSVANSGLVPKHTAHVNCPSSASPVNPQTSLRSSRAITPSSGQSHPSTSRVACVRQSLQARGISGDAAKLILAAWRPVTNSVYNSAWNKWHSWCDERKIDSFCPTLANITAFLAHSFDKGLEYRTINTYRSALSGVLPPIEGFPVGQHPLVVRLLKGILNLRPALPRYQQAWDVNVAVDFLRSLPANEALPLSTLSQKLALLLALTAPKRSSELKMLDLRFMRFLPEEVVFQLPGLTKTSSDVKSVFFAKFDDCEKLCVVHCLQSYIERTKKFRQPLAPDIACQLLVSYHRPHKPVKSCSIARWIKTILMRAGINTNVFKSHSTRSASTSKATAGGVPLEEVLRKADWSGTSSFIRFYYRPSFSDVYARAILS